MALSPQKWTEGGQEQAADRGEEIRTYQYLFFLKVVISTTMEVLYCTSIVAYFLSACALELASLVFLFPFLPQPCGTPCTLHVFARVGALFDDGQFLVGALTRPHRPASGYQRMTN